MKSVEEGLTALLEENYELAAEILIPLSKEDNADALYYLGSLFHYGLGVVQNFNEAEKLKNRAFKKYKELAKQNVAERKNWGEDIKKLEVREETLSRWRGQSTFNKVINSANNECIDAIIDKQKALLSLAQDTIEHTLNSEDLDNYRKSLISLKYLQICKEKKLFKIGILKNFYRSSV